MASSFDKRWLIAGCAAVALAAGLLLPRPAGSQHAVQADATVPPALNGNVSPGSLSPGSSPSPADMAVYVCGAVKNPGVYTFAPGARVIDAIKQAGGPLPDADVEQINLAQPLGDAMKVTVPHKGQTLASDAFMSNDPPASSSYHHRRSHGRSSRSSAHKLAVGQTLDVNTATPEELVQLPGVGPSLAQRIVDYRQQNGPFQTVDDLQNVPGIGPSKFDRMAPFIRL
ncbi:MAG TPA: helix-hairpin-helix domain-containing protein [Candidatus Eremiobacteraceae bacterium]|nr:helix-hairpin-helix domain-containing protein [Candidatus Eremiobacteraceae bacterium]